MHWSSTVQISFSRDYGENCKQQEQESADDKPWVVDDLALETLACEHLPIIRLSVPFGLPHCLSEKIQYIFDQQTTS